MLKKEVYFGSLRGMRLSLAKEDNKLKEHIMVTIWPEPYNYEKTPKDKKQTMEFEFSTLGIEKALAWLDEQYLVQRPLWDSSTRLN